MSEHLEFVSLEEVKALPLHLDAGGAQAVQALLNEVLTRVHNRAVETALLSMPETILYLLRNQASKAKLFKDFSAENSDLVGDARFPATVEEIEALHPAWAYEQVLAEAARIHRAAKEVSRLGAVSDVRPDLEAADEFLQGAL